MVECKNVTVKAGKKTIINNISFKADKGNITVIIGMNGSGKTTLLRAISSNIRYSGEIYIDGKALSEIPAKERATLISSMPQSLPNIPVKVQTLVSFGRSPYTGLTGALCDTDKEYIASAIEECDIKKLTEQRVDKLSGGEKRKAFIAMMLAQNTEMLLLDEPLTNLDTPYRRYITELMKQRKAKGNTLICVLHDINLALEIADRIILLDKGKLCFDGTPYEMTENNIPEKHFGLCKCSYTDNNGNKGAIYK